jgi:hypothetical protein
MPSCGFEDCGRPDCDLCRWEDRMPEKAELIKRMEAERKRKEFVKPMKK